MRSRGPRQRAGDALELKLEIKLETEETEACDEEDRRREAGQASKQASKRCRAGRRLRGEERWVERSLPLEVEVEVGLWFAGCPPEVQRLFCCFCCFALPLLLDDPPTVLTSCANYTTALFSPDLHL